MSTKAAGTPGAASSKVARPVAESGHRPPRRRWKSRVLLLLLGPAAALVWAAPYLAARHVMLHGLEFTGSSEESMRIEFGDASLGWLSPIVLSDVVVHDLEGAPFASIASVASERPLWQILTDRSRPGRFLVDNSELTVIVRDDGSNLADVVRLLTERPSGEALAEFSLSAKSGRVQVLDIARNPLLQLEDISLHLSDQRAANRTIELKLTADAVEQESRHPLELAFAWSGPGDMDPLRSGRGQAAFQMAPLPLSVVAPRLQEMYPELTLHEGRVAGKMQADWDFTDSQQVQATGTLTAENLRATLAEADGRSREIHWLREQLTFDINGDYDPQADELQITTARVTSSPLSLDAAGQIRDLRGRCDVDLTGKLEYDLASLVETLSADYREHVRIDGLRTQRFAVRGPLVSEAAGSPQFDLSHVAMEADLSWDQADIFGVRSQQATLLARLAGGVIEIEPRDVPVSGGRWKGVPRVNMQAQPAHAEVERGLVLDNIQISREMCQLWLKYLFPSMADATRAEGRLSVSLSESYVPLDRMAAGRIKGTLSIHSANVKPGPFAEQIIGLATTIEGLIPGGRSRIGPALGDVWIEFPQQDIGFQMIDGRVFHSAMEFHVGDAVVRTTGSVGLDESLDVLVEIPIPDKWLQGQLLTDLLEGEVLRIPITGTFQNPRFDRRSIQEFGKRLAARATGGLLRRLLND